MVSQIAPPVSKAPYETPELKVEGTSAELTQGGRLAGHLDATFPAHTPRGSLTFS